jgi:hypothetical protein
MYTVGEFVNKSDAMKLLNIVIDENFPEANIVSQNEIGIIKKEINLTYNLTQTDTSSGIDDKTKYTIQLSALTKPADLSLFKSIKGVKENLCLDGFYRYTYGEIEGLKAAQMEKQRMIELGFPGAFLVKLENFNKKVEQTGEFTIQIESLSEPVNLSRYTLKGVKELIGNDGKYKYLYGTFTSVDEARKELKKIQKSGFENAFIVNTNKFK